MLVKRKYKCADVAVWGKPPPPYGGISVHISRLIPVLQKSNVSFQLYNLTLPQTNHKFVKDYSNKILLWFLKLYIGRSEKVHYLFTVKTSVRFFAVLFGLIRKRKIILSIHGASLHKSVLSGSVINRLMAKISVRYADVVIGVNTDICEMAIKLGANPTKVYHIPAFIPPQDTDIQPQYHLRDFLKNNTPKIVITGFLNSRAERDTYGLWRTLVVFSLFTKEYPDTRLIVVLQNNVSLNSPLILDYIKEIEKYKLSSHIMLHMSNNELWPILKMADLFIRPSESDGDAVSIREAVQFGVPVIASDCVKRLEVVETFTTGNNNSFLHALKKVVANLNKYRIFTKEYRLEDNSEKIINVIINQLSEKY